MTPVLLVRPRFHTTSESDLKGKLGLLYISRNDSMVLSISLLVRYGAKPYFQKSFPKFHHLELFWSMVKIISSPSHMPSTPPWSSSPAPGAAGFSSNSFVALYRIWLTSINIDAPSSTGSPVP